MVQMKFLSSVYKKIDFVLQTFYLYITLNQNKLKVITILGQLITDDGVIEINHDKSNNFLKVIPLMLSKDKLTCRKVKAVLRYLEPGAHGSVEEYVHHLHLILIARGNI